MLALLRTDTEFKVNDAVDPAEFVALYNTFRTYPIYRIGGKLGGVAAGPSVMTSDYSDDGTNNTLTVTDFPAPRYRNTLATQVQEIHY